MKIILLMLVTAWTGLAIPLVVANTTAMGARNGILVRNRPALKAAPVLRSVNIIVVVIYAQLLGRTVL